MRTRLSRPLPMTRATAATFRWPETPRNAATKAVCVVGRSVVQVKSSARMTLPLDRAQMSPTSTAWAVRTGATTGSVSPRRYCKAGISPPPFNGFEELLRREGLVCGLRRPAGGLPGQGGGFPGGRLLEERGPEGADLLGQRPELLPQGTALALGVARLAGRPVGDGGGLVGVVAFAAQLADVGADGVLTGALCQGLPGLLLDHHPARLVLLVFHAAGLGGLGRAAPVRGHAEELADLGNFLGAGKGRVIDTRLRGVEDGLLVVAAGLGGR